MTALLAILLLASAETVSDTEVWNRGVDCYYAGDVTNAMQTLRPLVYSPGYAARAAEVLAKLEYDCGNQEEAAAMAQIALRARPDGEREKRNFALATQGLREQRENRRRDAAIKAAQGKAPGDILLAATREARELFVESGTYRTNEAVRAVALSDALSARADRLADVWIPVRMAILQSATNENEVATILQQLDDARQITLDAAKQLGDFDGEAYSSLSQAEDRFTAFLKLCIMPPGALDEDLTAQSNACVKAESFNNRDWQREALDYTRAFRMRFPEWARNYEQQAQSDTNLVAFSGEDQAKISALATELEKVQLSCLEQPETPEQEKALELISEIGSLLPKNGRGGGAGETGQKAESEPPPEAGEGKPDENPPPEPQETPAETQEPENPEERELEALLKKAEERNDEHEAEKKAMMRRAKMPPNERDW